MMEIFCMCEYYKTATSLLIKAYWMTVTSLAQLLELEELLVLHDMEPILAYLTGQLTEYSLYDLDLISSNIILEKFRTPLFFFFFLSMKWCFRRRKCLSRRQLLCLSMICLFSHSTAAIETMRLLIRRARHSFHHCIQS